MGIRLMIYRRGLKKLFSLPVQSLRRRGSRETILEQQQLSKGEATPVNQMKQIVFAVFSCFPPISENCISMEDIHGHSPDDLPKGSEEVVLIACAIFKT